MLYSFSQHHQIRPLQSSQSALDRRTPSAPAARPVQLPITAQSPGRPATTATQWGPAVRAPAAFTLHVPTASSRVGRGDTLPGALLPLPGGAPHRPVRTH